MICKSVPLCVIFLTIFLSVVSSQDPGIRRKMVRRKKHMVLGQRGGTPVKIIRKPISKPEIDVDYNDIDSDEKPVRQRLVKRRKNPLVVKSDIGSRRQYQPLTKLPTKSTTVRPENRPFSPNISVDAKPDAAKRFLSLFTIVSFKNDVCTSTSGNNGTCYSSNDCSTLGGTSSGTCASGFGVCCLFTATCGASTAVNGTYFQNEGYPSTFDSVGSCQLTINKCSDSVCQLRLDLDNFVLNGPETTDNQCQAEQFIVSGGTPVPAICGTNTGIHMYVDMGLSSNSPVVLTVVTSGQSFSRSFSVKVTQIECNSLAKAAEGCLQYFTGVSGQVFSFNYNDATGLQLSDTDYSICVRMERNFCGIQYTACPDNTNSPSQSFSVTGGSPAQGSVVGTQCSTDWITIPCATNTNDPTTQSGTPVVCVDRICGEVFNSATTSSGSPSVPVYSFSKPFHIYVHTDSLEGSSSPAESSNRGFCLNFVQQPCTSSTGKKK